jgi:hypothetical protein
MQQVQPIGRPRQPGSVDAVLPEAAQLALQASGSGRTLLADSKPDRMTDALKAVYQRIDDRTKNPDSPQLLKFNVSPQAVAMASLAADDYNSDKVYTLMQAFSSNMWSFIAAMALSAPANEYGEQAVAVVLRSILLEGRLPTTADQGLPVPFPWTGLPTVAGGSRVGAALILLDYLVAMQDLPWPIERFELLADVCATLARGAEQLAALSEDTRSMLSFVFNYTLPYVTPRPSAETIDARLAKAMHIIAALQKLGVSLAGPEYPLDNSSAWHTLARLSFATGGATVGNIAARARLYAQVMSTADPMQLGRVPMVSTSSGAKAAAGGRSAKSTASGGGAPAAVSSGPQKRARQTDGAPATSTGELEPAFDMKTLHIISDSAFNSAYLRAAGGATRAFPWSAARYSLDSLADSINGSSMFSSGQYLLLRLAYLYPDETVALLAGLKPPATTQLANLHLQARLLAFVGSDRDSGAGSASETWASISAMYNALASGVNPAPVVTYLMDEAWVEQTSGGGGMTLAEHVKTLGPMKRSTKMVLTLGLLTKFLVRYQAFADESELTNTQSGAIVALFNRFVVPLAQAPADAAMILANIGWLFGVESLRTAVPGAVAMHKLYMAGLEPWPADQAVPARLRAIYGTLVMLVLQAMVAVAAAAGRPAVTDDDVLRSFARDAIAMLTPATANMSMKAIGESKPALLDGQQTYPLLYVFETLASYYAAKQDTQALAMRASQMVAVLFNPSGAVIAALQ